MVIEALDEFDSSFTAYNESKTVDDDEKKPKVSIYFSI